MVLRRDFSLSLGPSSLVPLPSHRNIRNDVPGDLCFKMACVEIVQASEPTHTRPRARFAGRQTPKSIQHSGGYSGFAAGSVLLTFFVFPSVWLLFDDLLLLVQYFLLVLLSSTLAIACLPPQEALQ